MLRRRALWILCVVFLPAGAVSAQDALTPAQAAAKPGQNVTLHMRVNGVGFSGAGFVDLLSEINHQHPDTFIVRISPAAKDKFKEMKIPDVVKHFRQEFIRVTGTVKIVNYTNIGKRPVIDVTETAQLEIIDVEATQPPGEEILELYQSGKLFQRAAYKEVRAAFSRRFEANHQADLKAAYGDDFTAINAWLAKNPDTKENFYTALAEQYDEIPKALALFKEIWKRYPETLPKWSQLAIATAVTWDQERGIYDYRPHQTRVQGVLPDGMMDALANFRYVVDNEKRMPQPVFLYPWEFLVFVVNHRTPLPERNWAFNFFQVAKVSKSWHKDVPYDFEIIKRELEKNPSAANPKLAGKDYTLANIKTYGGVCAHQADFASRVAKSLGMPAVYCSGTSAYRDNHAWWMFINISSATKDEIKFALQSDGRFDGNDNFYTGRVLDPHSGATMLDRDMERRLWLAGTDRVGKRLSSLVMRAYPAIAHVSKFDTKEKVAYLQQCLKVSKYNEDAWLNFALLAKRGELKDENKKIALTQLASLNQTFAPYPDFIWKIFDDLIDVATPAEKIKQYDSVLAQFEKAKRADLACDARLKLTELLVEQAKPTTALTGLTNSVRKFPTEGRYVPKILKKMEDVAPSVKGGPAQVAAVYVDLIPGLILFYRSDTNIYSKKMTDQARLFLQANNLTQATNTLEARIVQAKASLKFKK